MKNSILRGLSKRNLWWVNALFLLKFWTEVEVWVRDSISNNNKIKLIKHPVLLNRSFKIIKKISIKKSKIVENLLKKFSPKFIDFNEFKIII